jgi:hypothetical protein
MQPAVTATMDANATSTFDVFVLSDATVSFNPAVNRIFVRASFGGASVGATSVAVQSE